MKLPPQSIQSLFGWGMSQINKIKMKQFYNENFIFTLNTYFLGGALMEETAESGESPLSKPLLALPLVKNIKNTKNSGVWGFLKGQLLLQLN